MKKGTPSKNGKIGHQTTKMEQKPNQWKKTQSNSLWLLLNKIEG
jgi:hypothetical protein